MRSSHGRRRDHALWNAGRALPGPAASRPVATARAEPDGQMRDHEPPPPVSACGVSMRFPDLLERAGLTDSRCTEALTAQCRGLDEKTEVVARVGRMRTEARRVGVVRDSRHTGRIATTVLPPREHTSRPASAVTDARPAPAACPSVHSAGAGAQAESTAGPAVAPVTPPSPKTRLPMLTPRTPLPIPSTTPTASRPGIAGMASERKSRAAPLRTFRSAGLTPAAITGHGSRRPRAGGPVLPR